MNDAGRSLAQELHDGPPVVARPAATVVLVRGGETTLEVLLVRRTPKARFMAGVWVFPGGAVDPGDGEGARGLRAAAVREVAEEVGITLASDAELVVYSNWITPERASIRFDTWFFLARMPADQRVQVDGHEVVDARWLRPEAALAAADGGELAIVLPTRKHLEQLAGHASAQALLAATSGRGPVPAVQPRVIGTGDGARILLPGEPGYDD